MRATLVWLLGFAFLVVGALLLDSGSRVIGGVLIMVATVLVFSTRLGGTGAGAGGA